MVRRLFFLSTGIAVLLGGCTLTPKYTRPDAPVSNDWPTGSAYKESQAAPGAPATSDLQWREFFSDERLQKVIDSALRNNRDLRLAALNVERARAFYGIQRAELWPTLDAEGNGGKQRVPGDLSGTGKAMTVEHYSADLSVSSWEIDFFGRIRSLKDAALEEYLATEQARRSAQIMLVSNTADVWLALAANQQNLKIAQSTLDSRETSYNLIRTRYNHGLASKLDLRQAQSLVDGAREEVGRYTQFIAQDENALNFLAGLPVPQALLPMDLDSVRPPRELAPGLPSEVLLGRPDVLAAEHLLKAANANIGAARAAFFPRITLTTDAGTASAELSGLFSDGSGAWSFGPKVSMPIFDARIWSAYEVTKVEKEIFLVQYEKAIQTAFREVADSLAVKGTVDQRIAAQESRVESLKETYRLADLRYTRGIDSFLTVLDAQRSLYVTQQVLIALRLARNANLVALYRVLGGGDM